MSLGLGFFFGFDNTPTQFSDDIWGEESGPSLITPPPSPPPEPNNAASLAVQQALQRQQLRRKSLLQTIHAGNNGGWRPPAYQFSVGQLGNTGPGLPAGGHK